MAMNERQLRSMRAIDALQLAIVFLVVAALAGVAGSAIGGIIVAETGVAGSVADTHEAPAADDRIAP